jgi:acyl transferase domain-containing protein
MSGAQGATPDARKIVLMFSGQGSQYYQMGKPLLEQQPLFRDHMERLDRFVVDRTGASVIDQIYSMRSRAEAGFDDITITNPAIFMVEYALARTLLDKGLRVDMTLGASLGSFAAMAISGMLDEKAALAMVIRMANAADAVAPRGGMIAVMAPPSLMADKFLQGHSEVAAINFDSHFVLSARAEHIDRVESYLAEKDVLFQRLPVAFAFHSAAVDCLEERIRNLTAGIHLLPARIPFACCAHARVLTHVPADYFWTLLRGPIRFGETGRFLESQYPYHYIDAGPSGTLSTFMKYLLAPEASRRIMQTMTPFGNDNDNVSALIAAFQRPVPGIGEP